MFKEYLFDDDFFMLLEQLREFTFGKKITKGKISISFIAIKYIILIV